MGIDVKGKVTRLKWGWRSKEFWKDVTILYSSKILYRRNRGSFVTSEDWDYLIILDACRYDVFKEEIKKRNMRGELGYRISRGSATPEFLLENFRKGNFRNIVYITANPYVNMLLKDKFYKIIPVWKDGWNEELNTVHPKTVYEYTLDALAMYPDKRAIIHFMQPHYPFITLKLRADTGIENLRRAALEGKNIWQETTVWSLVRAGLIAHEDAINAYRENLRIALNYVEKLLNILSGKIVVSSDHGEAFGEKLHPLIPIKVYGHYIGVKIEPLIKVPWLVVYNDTRSISQSEDGEHLKIKRAVRKIKYTKGVKI